MRYLTILLLGLALSSCQRLWPWSKKANADMLQLYTVERSPTPPDKQLPETTYILDFAVLDPVELRTEEAQALYTAIKDSTNFAPETTRRCPFIGQYAIEVGGELSAILSTSPCAKVHLKYSTAEQVQYLDLTEKNRVEKICAGLGSVE